MVTERVGVAGDHRDEADVVVALGALDRVTGLLGELESTLVGGARRGDVVAPVRQTADGGERIDVELRVGWRGLAAAARAGRGPRG